jgi:hypothetical protein
MNPKITKKDVFLYFADKLERDRRREVEAAWRSDVRVQRWFEELTPTEEELRQRPRPGVRLDSPAYRDLAAVTYLSVERDERAGLADQWSEWVRNWVTAGKSTLAALGEIVPSELLEGARGALLYREPVLTVGGDKGTFSVPPPEVPCVHPDYPGGRLIIRQRLEGAPGGVVEVVVVRRRGENEVETLPPVRIQLERAEPPDGAPYWYADVPLRSVLGDFRAGDDFIYCVEAAPGA